MECPYCQKNEFIVLEKEDKGEHFGLIKTKTFYRCKCPCGQEFWFVSLVNKH